MYIYFNYLKKKNGTAKINSFFLFTDVETFTCLYSGCEFGSSGTCPSLERISWGHIDGVKAENGPPGVGINPSANGPSHGSVVFNPSTTSSSSDNAVSTLTYGNND